jgi:hypothetical protein
MNQVVRGTLVKDPAPGAGGVTKLVVDPVACAAAAIERCLARAHEEGNDEAVRLLHAVSALLSASPRS